jgi:hypothetical protein
MPETHERDFKGVWIPSVVYLDERLSPLDKIILAEIDSLDLSDKGCYASNKYIADFCQCSESKVTKSIAKLIEYGYLYVQSFDGRKRELRSRLSHYAIETGKKYEADKQNLRESNNRLLKKNIKNSSRKSEPSTDGMFDTFWKAYPRKVNKQAAEKAFNKLNPSENLFKAIMAGLENHKKSKQWTDPQYIPHASTWLNGKRWEDELESAANPQQQPEWDGESNPFANSGW